MANNIDPMDLDPEEAAWFRQKEMAAARRNAVKATIKPEGMSDAEYDVQREAAMRRDQARIRAEAGIVPGALNGEIVDAFAIDTSISVPDMDLPSVSTIPGGVTQVTPNTSPIARPLQSLEFWDCYINGTRWFAASWNDLKEKISKLSTELQKDLVGVQQANQYKVSVDAKALIDFFDGRDQKAINTFEIIIQNGKFFRSEA